MRLSLFSHQCVCSIFRLEKSPKHNSRGGAGFAWIGEIDPSCRCRFLIGERRKTSSETDNGGTTPRTKIYIYTLSCQRLLAALLLYFFLFWSRKWLESPPKKSPRFSSYKSKICVWGQLGDGGDAESRRLEGLGEGTASRFGRTVCSIYMCSTLIYLLFTNSVRTVHPQISMVARSQMAM